MCAVSFRHSPYLKGSERSSKLLCKFLAKVNICILYKGIQIKHKLYLNTNDFLIETHFKINFNVTQVLLNSDSDSICFGFNSA